jgi:hypothetical protein
VIIGNLDYLRSTVTGDQRSTKLVESAMKAARNGAELNRRLLAFSRKQPLMPMTLDLNSQVAGTIEMLQRSLGENIEIRTAFGDGLWSCLADPAQLESALLNLAVNARDAMPDGGVLTIETANVEVDTLSESPASNLAPGGYVKLSVSDTGTGMAPDVLEHAFEPFFTTKDVGQGSGLGLSMVFGFVRQSGGDVSVQSEPGRGTTITLYLPRSTRADSVADDFKDEDVPYARGETVLLVEDNDELRELCLSFLQDLGYQVLTAENGLAALDIVGREPNLDLLLCDVVLPGKTNGPEIARRFQEQHPTGRILFMSGYTQDAFQSNAALEQRGLLVKKPFTRTELAQRLRSVLDAPDEGHAVNF